MRCPKCGGATSVSTVGSITQWLSACSCSLLDAAPSEQSGTIIHLCATCGKRISAGRSGSLTQWVFRLDLCSCTNPKPIDVPSSAIVSTAAAIAEFETALSGAALDTSTASLPKSLPGFISGQIKALESGTLSGFDQALLTPSPDKFPLERYNLMALIGQGSSGTVYYCQDRLLNKMVAVKALHTLNSVQLVAFQREAKATSRLNHPSIIQVYDFGATTGGVPYMCMEFVNGMSLERFLTEGSKLSIDDTLKLFNRICEGLAHAHVHGILHRDIKSSNILVGDDGSGGLQAKIIDFGVAVWRSNRAENVAEGGDEERARGDGSVAALGVGNEATGSVSSDIQDESMAGSPNYMPPDQSMGFEYDERSEVYGLGCTLFEALAGQVPFPGRTTYETMRMHAEMEPPKLSDIKPDVQFSEELEQLLAKCLKKSQSERFQTVMELGEALLKLTSDNAPQTQVIDNDEELFPAPPVLAAPPTEKERRLNLRNLLYLSCCLLAIVIVLVGFFATGIQKDQAPRPEAVQEDLKVRNMTEMLGTLMEPHFDKGRNRGPDWYCAKGEVSDHDLKLLRDIPNMRKVSLLGDKVTGKGLKDIQDLPLTGLDMTSTLLNDKTIEYVAKFNTLVELDIDRTPQLTDKGLKKIESLRKLEFLSIGPNITDNGLDSVTKLLKLNTLRLEGCRGITARGIKRLAVLKDLQDLTVTALKPEPEITAALTSLPVLDSLSVENMRFDRQSLNNITKLDKLKQLVLKGCTVDPNCAEILAHLRIRRLKLDGMSVPRTLWNTVGSMKTIKELVVRNCDMHDEELQKVCKLTELEELSLGQRKVLSDGSQSNALTDKGFVYIKNLRNLNSLDLVGVAITDSGIASLEGLTKLEQLQLSGPGVTDKGLRFLAKLTALRELNLFGCPNITEGGTNRLKAKLPDCRVTLKVGEHSGEGL